MNLKDKLREVPNFPKEGIVFIDITTLIKDGVAFRHAIDALTERYRNKRIDMVVAVEARGFLFGAPLAYNLGTGIVPVRKEGKLPSEILRAEYALEYGNNVVEMHSDGISPGQRVLVVDDLLATGGTAVATVQLVERLGGEVVSLAFLVELSFLSGRDKLEGYEVYSLVQYKTQ